MNSKTQTNFIMGAVVGGALSALVTLLFTPIAGSKIRAHLSNGFNGVLNGHKHKSPSHKHASTTRKPKQKAMAVKHTHKKKAK